MKYKSLKIILFLTTITTSAFAQSYTWISSSYYSYVEISVEYTRTSTSNSFGYSNALAYKQNQYDDAWHEVNSVYGQMNKLQLLNKINRAYLNSYRDKYFQQIATDTKKLDLSIDQNKNWAIDNFRKPVTSNKNIRNEIKILNKLGKEIDFIEHDAYRFSKEQVGDIELKKKNIAAFLEEYENADPSNTQILLKKYDLYLMMLSESLDN